MGFFWKLQNTSYHHQLRKWLGQGTCRMWPIQWGTSLRTVQHQTGYCGSRKSFFPWRKHILQHLVHHGNSSSSGLTAAHPEGSFVYMADGCFPAGNLHSPLPLSVYHRLHPWIEPLTRPNPALRDTGTNPMEEKKICVCIRQSKVWSLPTIFLEIANVEASAWVAYMKGLKLLKYPLSLFSIDSTTPRQIIQQFPSSLHIHLTSSSQQGKNLWQCHLPSLLKMVVGTKPKFSERGSISERSNAFWFLRCLTWGISILFLLGGCFEHFSLLQVENKWCGLWTSQYFFRVMR